MRLVGGANSLEGRVEFCLGRAWGTVCTNRFSTSDAEVVCRQLGVAFDGTAVLNISEFSRGIGPIFVDELSCDGGEVRVGECRRGRAFGLHTCEHSQDVAVRCIGECVCTRTKWIGNSVQNILRTVT